MAIPTRLLTATCNIDNGTLTAQNRPPVFTGESGAMEVSVTFKKGGESYTIPSGVVASLYLYYPNTELMTIASEMVIDGATATGTLTEAQLGKEGYPMLMIQLADPETESMIVAASFPIKVTKSRGNYVVDIRPPSPSEIVYVGRSPYINTQNDHWMQWDSGNQQYEDTGVKATGYSPYINSTNNHWMVWDESQGEYVDTQISATGVDQIDDTAGTGVTTKTWSANKLVSQFDAKANTTDIPGDMTGASASTAGTHGLVPAPSAGDQGKVLYGDCSWKTPPGGDVQTVNGVHPDSQGDVDVKGSNIAVSGSDSTKIDTALSNKADKTDTYTKAQVDALLTSVFHYKGSKATYAEIEAVTGQAVGDVWGCNADNSEYAWTGTAWEKLGPTIDLSAYLTSLSVAGITIDSTHTTITASQLMSAIGAVPTSRTINGHALTDNITVTQSDVGLGNVDNTSDANKPISTATQTALNAKANTTDIPGDMTGASSEAAGTHGLVPQPPAGADTKVLYGDATWKSPPEGTVKTVNSISPNSSGNVLLKGSDIQLKAMRLQTVAQAIAELDGKTGSDIPVNSADSTKIASALSTLNDQIVNLGPYNGLDSDSIVAALSAAQGKVLDTKINAAKFTRAIYAAQDVTIVQGATSIFNADVCVLYNDSIMAINGMISLSGVLDNLPIQIAIPNPTGKQFYAINGSCQIGRRTLVNAHQVLLFGDAGMCYYDTNTIRFDERYTLSQKYAADYGEFIISCVVKFT